MKVYASILDQILDDVAPAGSDSDVREALKEGDGIKAISEAEADTKFLDDIAGPSKHTNINRSASTPEGWRERSAKVVEDEGSLIGSALSHLAGAEGNAGGFKRMAQEDVNMRIRTFLQLGYTPSKVAAYLNKLAEHVLFDRNQSADFLNSQAGKLGLLYIEPNHYMGSCEKTFDFSKKNGHVRALAVKKVAECTGCQHHKKHGEEHRCAMYKLPIVASAQGLQKIVDASVKGPKTAAALKAMHDQKTERAAAVVVGAREHYKTTIRTASDKDIKESEICNAKDVEKLMKEGNAIEKVHAFLRGKVGSVRAGEAVVSYIKSLKGSHARIALANLDCAFLKQRLASSETIVGSSKCSSCTYRSGMHCGMTGGTLLSFPGMEKTGPKTASTGVDGNKLMDDYGLSSVNRPKVGTIEEEPDQRLNVEMDSTMQVRF